MSAHHDEQQELENAKHLWRRGGKWVFALLVAAAYKAALDKLPEDSLSRELVEAKLSQ